MRPNILDKTFRYDPANDTDVQRKWRQYGWQPIQKSTGEDDARGDVHLDLEEASTGTDR